MPGFLPPRREGIFPIDHGIDFYAPQTLETPDGRRIMIAWMQNWETSSFVPEGQTFFGQMTLPRELSIRIRPADDAVRYKWFCLKVAQSGQYDTSIRYEPGNSMLRVDRSRSGFPCDMTNVREFPVRNREGALDLRIIMDQYSLEIFANEGEQAATFAIFTPENASGISFLCEGSLLMDIDKYVCSGKETVSCFDL